MTSISTRYTKTVFNRQAVAKFNDRGRRGSRPWYVSTKAVGIRKANPDDKGEVFTFKTEEEAWDRAAEINWQLRNGGAIGVAAAKTFGHAAQIFIEQCERQRDGGFKVAAYMDDYIAYAFQWVDQKIGDTTLGNIKCLDIIHEDMDHLLNNWSTDSRKNNKVIGSRPAAASTKQHRKNVASRILKIAINRGWAYKNVIKDVVILEQKYEDARGNKPQEVDKALQFKLKELRYIFQAALELDVPKFKKAGTMYEQAWCDGVAVLFAGTTGARFGEQAGATWRQVDFDTSRFTIDRAQRQGIHKGIISVGIPKETSKGKRKHQNRVVPIQPNTLKVLREWYARTPHKSPDDLIFPTRSGTCQHSPNNWNRFLKRVIKRAKENATAIEGQNFKFQKQAFTWKALRHFYASILVSQHGSDFVKIADRMGHQNVQTARDHYAEWINDLKGDLDEAKRANDMLWGSS